MWVVKLGGSLANNVILRKWLSVLSCYGSGRIIIVPGGGPFADQVRVMQGLWAYDDGTAHQMALLAMDQYGLMLTAMGDKLVPAVTMDELLCKPRSDEVPVWIPSKLILHDPHIPRCWSVTSDSLAAWLARQIAAEKIILVKSTVVDAQSITMCEVERRGIVDAAFAMFTKTGTFSIHLTGPDDYPAIESFIKGNTNKLGTLISLPLSD